MQSFFQKISNHPVRGRSNIHACFSKNRKKERLSSLQTDICRLLVNFSSSINLTFSTYTFQNKNFLAASTRCFSSYVSFFIFRACSKMSGIFFKKNLDFFLFFSLFSSILLCFWIFFKVISFLEFLLSHINFKFHDVHSQCRVTVSFIEKASFQHYGGRE